MLDHHAQPSVIAAARRTHHAVDDLLLQHEGHVDNAVALLEQVKYERCGNVIGQVADYTQSGVARDGADVRFESIALMYAQTSIHAFCQPQELWHQIAVKLDDIQVGSGIEQGQGYRAATRPDLQQAFAGAWTDGVDDTGDNAGRMQEVLPQPLLRFGMAFQEALLSAAIIASAVRKA